MMKETLRQANALIKWNDENKEAIEQVRINIETIARVIEVLNRTR